MEKTISKISNQTQIVENDPKVQKISFCGVMKDNTELLQKLESEMPSLFQDYSDLYTRYLHSIQDAYGACNLAERQYFEKMEVDQSFLKIFDDYFKSNTKILESQIDMSTSFVREYIQSRLAFIDSWDKYAHTCVNMYAKSLSQFIQRKSSNVVK